MDTRHVGLTAETLFVAMTRPPMRFGVTYLGLLANLVFTMEVFILTRNFLVLLLALPIHGICALLCARDLRYFDLAAMWGRTRLLGVVTTLRYWKGASYSPLSLDLPDRVGRRRGQGVVEVRL